jgi:hypothetical protein
MVCGGVLSDMMRTGEERVEKWETDERRISG